MRVVQQLSDNDRQILNLSPMFVVFMISMIVIGVIIGLSIGVWVPL